MSIADVMENWKRSTRHKEPQMKKTCIHRAVMMSHKEMIYTKPNAKWKESAKGWNGDASFCSSTAVKGLMLGKSFHPHGLFPLWQNEIMCIIPKVFSSSKNRMSPYYCSWCFCSFISQQAKIMEWKYQRLNLAWR